MRGASRRFLKKVETTSSLKRRDAASPSHIGHNIAVDSTLKIDDLCIALFLREQLRHDNHSVGDIIHAGNYVKNLHLPRISRKTFARLAGDQAVRVDSTLDTKRDLEHPIRLTRLRN